MAAMNGRISALLTIIFGFFLTLSLRLANTSPVSNVAVVGTSSCQEITIDMCKDLPYNLTTYPNLVDNENQAEAQLQLSTFEPLVQVSCSNQLKFFLCSVFAPMCTPQVPISIGPCRPLCESVRRRCEPMLSQFGFPWPASLNCSKFPLENSVASMCMRGPEEGDTPSSTPFGPLNTAPPRSPVTCQHNKLPGRYIYVNRTGSCSLRCGSHGLFGAGDKQLAETMAFVLASLSLLLALLSLLSVKCCQNTIQYPETPLLFVVVCFGCGSVAYMVRWFGGRAAISCVDYTGAEILVVSGLQQIRCTIVGIVLYFFTVSSRLWWLVLCWCCFMSAGLGWSSEALYLQQFWYHVFAWGFSVVMVVVSLVQKAVDADELTGMCYIGQQTGNESSLLALLAVPELVILICGAVLLSLAVVFSLRDSKRSHGVGTDGDLNVTVVVAAFCLPFATTLIVCYFYEYFNRKQWTEEAGPSSEIFLLKIAITFSYGLVSGVWILVRKWCCSISGRFSHRKAPVTSSMPVTVDFPREPMIPPTKSYSKHWVDL